MKTKLFFLTILFSFSILNVKAQCPEGDVQLLSQAAVDDFVATYPNCTHITGDLNFGVFGSGGGLNDINDLSGFQNLTNIDGQLGVFKTDVITLNGLQNLQQIGSLNLVDNYILESIHEMINITELSSGQLQIAFNDNLQSLQGLNNIEEISGRLYIGKNESLHSLAGLDNLRFVGGLAYLSGTELTNFEGLENLEYIGERIIITGNQNLEDLEALSNLSYLGGRVYISENPNLTSLMGIHNFTLALEGETYGVHLIDNNSLTQCNLPNICEYLSFNSTEYPREIIGNTGNCIDEQAVLAACGLGISDVENNSANWNVVFQKNTGSFLVQSNGFQMAEIEVYDLSGKLIKSIQNLNSNREELRVFTPENILIIKVKSQEGKSYAKKAIMK